ncbi:MAG: hypothetical protein U0S12_06275 [Fimbriimonadales bacterium]
MRKGIVQWLVLLALAILVLPGGCHSGSTSSASNATLENVQARGPEFGFASEDHLREHYSKHGAEFGSISLEEYLARARALRDAPVGGPILQVIRADTVRTRFDQSKGDFIAFGKDLTILTFFHPNDGERYFWRQASRPR